MEIVKSQIQLEHFHILALDYKFNAEENSKKPEIIRQFGSYNVDIDFAWKKTKDFSIVFCKLEINRGSEKKSGYSILAEGAGVFRFDKATETKDIADLLKYSATSIVIAEIRALLRQITIPGPAGPYTLPTVDIKAIIAAKIKTTPSFTKHRTTAQKVKKKKSKE